MDFTIRPATSDDFPAFTRLFPELRVTDPIPSLEIWTSAFVPFTLIAAHRKNVYGYCYCQEYEEIGYVRNVVVGPDARRHGIGHALMHATAENLRQRGKKSWRLNVRPDNRAAVALYTRMGMRAEYLGKTFRLPWSVLSSFPLSSAEVREPSRDCDSALEDQFGLPRGQLASARGLGRLILEAVSPATQSSMGLSVFNPKFPGAFPFRIGEVDAVRPLLEAMRVHVTDHDHVFLVVEDDVRLSNAFANAGASVADEYAHFVGAL